MKLVIIDDSIKESLNLNNLLLDCFKKLNIELSIDICNEVKNAEELSHYDLVFLDVEIGDLNGIKLGEEIREFNKDVPIIITTNYKQYAIDGYKIKANRYFLKPIDEDELFLELKSLLKDTIRNSMFYYDDKISFNKLYFKDIIYVEMLDRKSILHFTNARKIETNKTLKEWMTIFDGYGFCQIHKSFLINLHLIKSFNNNEVTMSNYEKIEISRHYKQAFKDEFNLRIVRGA